MSSDSVHIGVQFDVSKERYDKIDELCKLLVSLRDVARGKPLIDWDALVDANNPADSASQINAALGKCLQQHLGSSLAAIAKRISTPAHLSIVSMLEEKYRGRIRDDVLQRVLKELTTSGDETMPLCARMMAEMVRLELVLIRGVATTLDALLKDRASRRAAVAVIGQLAQLYQDEGNPAVLHIIHDTRATLESINDPSFEYDCNCVSRLAGWSPPPAASLVLFRSFRTPHLSNTISSAYFPGRDELVTGGSERTVAVWGGPTYGETPSATFQLPANTTPVSMDGSSKGNLLVVGCVTAARRDHTASVSSTSVVQGYICSEHGTWTSGDAIKRPEKTIVTNVRCVAVKGAVICTGESLDDSNHQVVFFNSQGAETRKINRAHQDYITTIASCPENETMLLTGSRDMTVRLWDARIASSAPPPSLLDSHKDTITSISSIRDVILTTSMDGVLKLWDVRRLKGELQEKKFASPILRSVCTTGTTAAVSTAQGLYMISLFPTLKVEDVIPNVRYTELKANHDGTVVFGCGAGCVDSYAVQITRSQ